MVQADHNGKLANEKKGKNDTIYVRHQKPNLKRNYVYLLKL